MAANAKRVPRKLKEDAIIEVVLEIRFESKTVPEVLFGRFADHSLWKDFEQRKLPAYQLPEALRQAQATLRHQPIFELVNEEKKRAIRLGGRVLSYHLLAPYVGWTTLKPELEEAIGTLFEKTQELKISRLGLRYINAIRPNAHFVSGISDLDLSIVVGDEPVTGSLNLNFVTGLSEDSECTLRIATPNFVQGTFPDDSVLMIDVDVYTKADYEENNAEKVREWLEFAHTNEKEQFSRLLKQETIDALEVK